MNNILRKSDIETFHISVLKQLLGVHKRTTNIVMLLETGRYLSNYRAPPVKKIFFETSLFIEREFVEHILRK